MQNKLKKITTAINKYPILTIICVIAFYGIISNLSLIVLKKPILNLALNSKSLVGFCVQIITMSCAFITVLFFKYEYVYKKGNLIYALKTCYLYLIYLIAVLTYRFIKICQNHCEFKNPIEIFFGIVTVFSIGFNEESIFRGVISNCLAKKYGTTKKGIWICVTMSGIIFGGIHATNMFVVDNPIAAIYQAIGNIPAGMFFTALYFRGKNIWVLIILHAMLDTIPLFKPLFIEGAKSTILTTLGAIDIEYMLIMPTYLILTYIVLRKDKTNICIKNIQSINNIKKLTVKKAF